MAGVRVLVGTAKGAFVVTSDEERRDWTVDGPHFGGWQVMHVQGSPADPDRLYASQWTDWHGQVVQRSDDGGATWQTVGNDLAYGSEPGTHHDFDGSEIPWRFKRIWNLTPSPVDRDVVFAGVEDAALFRSDDAGMTWTEMEGIRTHATADAWQPGAGGLCLHTILIAPNDVDRMFIAVSAVGAFRTTDGGANWELVTRGLSSEHLPDAEADAGHCVHKLAMHPDRPDTLYMQKHWNVLRTDDAGDWWTNVGSDLPSDFGFPIAVHPHEPETIYVIPIKSDAEHYPPDGALRVARSRTGGNEWELLTAGLPQQHVHTNVLRDALAIDSLTTPGLYFGTTGGTLFGSSDAGDSWAPIVEHLPRIHSVEVQTLS